MVSRLAEPRLTRVEEKRSRAHERSPRGICWCMEVPTKEGNHSVLVSDLDDPVPGIVGFTYEGGDPVYNW